MESTTAYKQIQPGNNALGAKAAHHTGIDRRSDIDRRDPPVPGSATALEGS